jgi:2-(1,2-epoxy-1,2-dihydrophenyl)acetyl-CoA isomerase
MSNALSLAERLAKSSTKAFYRTRLAIDGSWTKSFPEQLEEERHAQAYLGNTPEFINGVKSFIAKGKPAAEGKSKL